MGRDVALDLGTANTLVYKQGEGIVFNQPTVVAMNAASGKVEAMGDEAWKMIGGRSGQVVAVRPLRHGVMTEFDITQRMIEVVLKRVGVSRFPKPRALACISSESSEVERRAVEGHPWPRTPWTSSLIACPPGYIPSATRTAAMVTIANRPMTPPIRVRH